MGAGKVGKPAPNWAGSGDVLQSGAAAGPGPGCAGSVLLTGAALGRCCASNRSSELARSMAYTLRHCQQGA